jgi:hypothetical protein
MAISVCMFIYFIFILFYFLRNFKKNTNANYLTLLDTKLPFPVLGWPVSKAISVPFLKGLKWPLSSRI